MRSKNHPFKCKDFATIETVWLSGDKDLIGSTVLISELPIEWEDDTEWISCTIKSPDFWFKKTGMSIWNLRCKLKEIKNAT